MPTFTGARILRYNLEISLEQAARGTETKIRIPTMEVCDTAMAAAPSQALRPSHALPATAMGKSECSRGFSRSSRHVPKCHGSGKFISSPCATCSGSGRVRQHKTLSVKIPAGVDEGDRIRLSGEGEAGVNNGPPGDLYVVIHLTAHSVFQRDHNDLHCEMPISFTTAALGGEIEIPTLDGHAKIRVPAETQSGKIFRLRGKGIKGRAQQYARRPAVSRSGGNTGQADRASERTIAGTGKSMNQEDSRHSPRAKSWMDKVRRVFCGVGFLGGYIREVQDLYRLCSPAHSKRYSSSYQGDNCVSLVFGSLPY